jgi:hypothetical protein
LKKHPARLVHDRVYNLCAPGPSEAASGYAEDSRAAAAEQYPGYGHGHVDAGFPPQAARPTLPPLSSARTDCATAFQAATGGAGGLAAAPALLSTAAAADPSLTNAPKSPQTPAAAGIVAQASLQSPSVPPPGGREPSAIPPASPQPPTQANGHGNTQPHSGPLRDRGVEVLCEAAAHASPLAAMAWYGDASLLATASTKGTVVRVHRWAFLMGGGASRMGEWAMTNGGW